MPTRSAFLASAGVRTDRDVDIRLQEPNRRPVEYRRILQTIRGPVVYQRQVPRLAETEDDGILTIPSRHSPSAKTASPNLIVSGDTGSQAIDPQTRSVPTESSVTSTPESVNVSWRRFTLPG
jgi:hypothetical protein